MNSVSGLCLCLRDTALEFNLSFDMCRWLVEGEDVGVVHKVLVTHHRLFNQQAFAEAIGIAIAAIAQACAIVSQGGSNDLQRLEAHRPPMVRGGVDSRVRTTMTTKGEVDVMQGIQDMGAGTKRKENPSSSNPRKKQKTSVSHGPQRQGQGYQD